VGVWGYDCTVWLLNPQGVPFLGFKAQVLPPEIKLPPFEPWVLQSPLLSADCQLSTPFYYCYCVLSTAIWKSTTLCRYSFPGNGSYSQGPEKEPEIKRMIFKVLPPKNCTRSGWGVQGIQMQEQGEQGKQVGQGQGQA
jgi:hypothetical protein